MKAVRHQAMREFLAGWFHQDFDIEGATVEEVVAAYCRVAPRGERQELQTDIEVFLNEGPGSVDARLDTEFELDIIPSALAADGEDFLRTIQRLLDPA